MVDYFKNKPALIRSVQQRSRCIVALFGIGILVLITKLGYLQINQHQRYVTLSEKNFLAIIPIQASRGLILDRNGVILAKNTTSFDLNVLPRHVKSVEHAVDKATEFFKISAKDKRDFYKQIKKQKRDYQSVVLKRNLSEQEVARYYINQYRLNGIVLQAKLVRQYPFSDEMAHIIGYISKINLNDQKNLDLNRYIATDMIGKVGVEQRFENQLHGQPGYQQVEIDASGHLIRSLNTVQPKSGRNIKLTLDINLQKKVNQLLRPYEGAVVVLDGRTGEALALSSQPSFDPNQFVAGISSTRYKQLNQDPNKPLFNRFIRGAYAPGSIIKPFIALDALNKKKIRPHTTFSDSGFYSVPGSSHVYRDWNWDKGGHGTVDVYTSLIVSCDTFFYRIAYMLGIKSISQILSQFGLGQKTGIELPGERSGIVPSPQWKRKYYGSSWYKGDTVITGIGQGFMLATPVQMAKATLILANKGHDKPVTLIKNNAVKNQRVQKTITLKNPSHWHLIDEALVGVINSSVPWGTGYAFGRHPPYSVAAKTGTAQVFSIKNRHNDHKVKQEDLPKKLRDNALFIAYSPVDHPKIIVAVVIEHNKTSIAARITRQIIDYYYQHQRSI